jgi:hypothetical protein
MMRWFVLSVFLVPLAQEQKVPRKCDELSEQAWNKQLRYVFVGCDNRLKSPDGKATLHIGELTEVLIGERSVLRLRMPVEAPAMVSWSPASDAFFIDDGAGSSQASRFRLFRLRGDQVTEDSTIHTKAVRAYREKIRCERSGIDPNVWGIGWSADGAQIQLIVQSTIHEPCGSAEQFIGLIVRLSDGAIVKELSRTEAQKEFRALLPPEMLFKN